VEIVIGGVGGVGLDEVGFDRKTLKESYGYSEAEAEQAEGFLHGIRAYDNSLVNSLMPELTAIVAGQAGKGIAGLKESVLSRIEQRPGTRYTLASNAGLGAYIGRGGTGLSRARIEELVRERTGSAGSAASIPDIRRIEPVYRSVPGVVEFTRTAPKGMPEKVYRQAYSGAAFSGAPAALTENAVSISRGGKAGVNAGVPSGGTVDNTKAAAVPFTRGPGSGVPLSAAVLPGGGKEPSPAVHEPAAQGAAPEIAALGMERRRERNGKRDAEFERLRKINANYEKDKAKLARERAPALARSASHDIGHAEGSEEDTISAKQVLLDVSDRLVDTLRKRARI
jgi:hypothetical protein